MTGSRVSLLALLGGLALAVCQWLIFVYAPEEQVMGLAQKIFYIHLPLAWWGLVSFIIAAVCGIIAKTTGGCISEFTNHKISYEITYCKKCNNSIFLNAISRLILAFLQKNGYI